MRYYLAALFLLAATGEVLAQNPERRRQTDKRPMTQPEVLCERIEFGHSFLGSSVPGLDTNRELIANSGEQMQPNRYCLSSVTVPARGWKVECVSIFIYPVQSSEPADWSKVSLARLNVFAKKCSLPDEEDDPGLGREVEISVREMQDDVYEVRAANLGLTLAPGEYWIGLTPICPQAAYAGQHRTTVNVRNARFDDVYYVMRDDPKEREWAAINARRPGMHLSIRIEGQHIRRGRLLDWHPAKGAGPKQLHLRFGTFDPVTQPPGFSEEPSTPNGNLWIVQCRHTMDGVFRDQLTQVGAKLLRYVPDDAYIVQLKPETVVSLRKLDTIRWIGPYHPAYRLDPNLSPERFECNGSDLPMRSHLLEPEGWRHVFVHLFNRDEGSKQLVRQVVEDIGGKVVFQSARGFYLAANVPQDKLAVVAQSDAVCAIERRFGAFELRTPGKSGSSLPPIGDGGITMPQIRELCGAEAVRKAGGYEGSGVRVAFWDTGIRKDHVDLLTRPLTVLGPEYWFDTEHGTQVASVLCGEGRGDPRATGLLPLGGLVFATDQGSPSHEDRYGLVEQFVKNHHAVVLSSSSSNWGGVTMLNRGQGYIKHYDGYSLLLDDLVLEHDLLICTAIGNSGDGMCGSWAKNALIVGGVDPRGSLRREDHRPGSFARGPALDGRMKPDLVHFADDVYCASASSTRGYGRFGGTSCATPLVAGHCGLMMEMWADGAFRNRPLGRSVYDRKPHAATARALMINSAYRYSIEGNNPDFTRFKQGWGMPDIGRLYESKKNLFVVNQENALRDHQAVEYRLRVPDGESELRVTLAYTDPLGSTSAAKALVNDLDLIVIAPDGRLYYGNHGLLGGNISSEGGMPDRLNNVENVFLDEPTPGVWQVIVAAHRIAWEQHRGSTAWDQDFALVVGGVESDPVPPMLFPIPDNPIQGTDDGSKHFPMSVR